MMARRFYPDQGTKDFRANIGSYGSNTDFFSKIYEACTLFPSGNKLLDGMSGPGKLGLAIRTRYNQEMPSGKLDLTFNDVRSEALVDLSDQGYRTIACDIREIGKYAPNEFDRVVVRYGIKDLPEGQATVALESIYSSLVNGGRIVLGEMAAYTPEGQSGIIQVHGGKQVLAGRDVGTEGMCFIPTIEQWLGYAQNAGFQDVKVTHHDYSIVKVGDWSGQFGKITGDSEMLARMRETIRKQVESNPTFAEETNAHRDSEGEWHISFPIFVLTAEKRE